MIGKTEKAYVELVEKDGEYRLKTNIYELLGAFTDGIVTSDIPGKAFVPEQYCENPDGTPIIFHEVYFGNHRGYDAILGPFAKGTNSLENLL